MQMQEKKQVGRFAVVGIINTLIDFVVLNVLVKFGVGPGVANVISVSVAMVNSFILNKQWTFHVGGNVAAQIAKFLGVTIFGMYVVHQTVFHLFFINLDPSAPPPLLNIDRYVSGLEPISLFVVDIVRGLGLGGIFSGAFIVLNFSKAMAIGGSLIWNYFGYKFLVFKKS